MKTGEQSHNQTLKSARYYVHLVWHILMWPIKIDQKCRVTGSRSYIRLGKTKSVHMERMNGGLQGFGLDFMDEKGDVLWHVLWEVPIALLNVIKYWQKPAQSLWDQHTLRFLLDWWNCIALADFCDKTLRSKRLRWYRESIFHFYFLPK